MGDDEKTIIDHCDQLGINDEGTWYCDVHKKVGRTYCPECAKRDAVLAAAISWNYATTLEERTKAELILRRACRLFTGYDKEK